MEEKEYSLLLSYFSRENPLSSVRHSIPTSGELFFEKVEKALVSDVCESYSCDRIYITHGGALICPENKVFPLPVLIKIICDFSPPPPTESINNFRKVAGNDATRETLLINIPNKTCSAIPLGGGGRRCQIILINTGIENALFLGHFRAQNPVLHSHT